MQALHHYCRNIAHNPRQISQAFKFLLATPPKRITQCKMAFAIPIVDKHGLLGKQLTTVLAVESPNTMSIEIFGYKILVSWLGYQIGKMDS